MLRFAAALVVLAATAELDVPSLEARLAAIREAEMTSEEHGRFAALLERVRAINRGMTGAVEDHPAALEADHAPAPAVDSSDALSSRLEAIKGRIEKSSELSSDPEVQAALRRVNAKFERAGLKAGSKPAASPKEAEAPPNDTAPPPQDRS